MKLYTVIMYKWGDHEEFSYLLGVYEDGLKALEEGENESVSRGGKYYPDVICVNLNDTKKREIVLSADDRNRSSLDRAVCRVKEIEKIDNPDDLQTQLFKEFGMIS